MRLSLVIPCYNESDGLKSLIELCSEVVKASGVEVIFVNNGSTDDSANRFQEHLMGNPKLKLVTLKHNKGYGGGILAGLDAAQGDFLGWTHADLQTNPMDSLKALKLLDYSAPLLIKGRRHGRPLGDAFFSRGMEIFESILFGLPLHEINAQPTIFSRSLYECWANPPVDFSLDLYAYVIAHTCNATIRRFPVNFGDRVHGSSHWNTGLKQKIKFIQRTIDYSFRLKKEMVK